MRKTLLALCALGAMALPAGAADYVILESDAAGIDAGLVVAASAEIVVPEGARVVMIDPAGQTRLVEGPYDGVISAAGAGGGASAVDRLTRSRGTDTKVLGAVRAPQVLGGSVKE